MACVRRFKVSSVYKLKRKKCSANNFIFQTQLDLFSKFDNQITDTLFWSRPENFEQMDKQILAIKEAPYTEVPRVQVLFDCEKKLLDMLMELGLGKLVLCHNDVNQKNQIWNAQNRSLGFIDFEMTL